MDHWQFFPSPESVFAGDEGDFFVPLASVDFGTLLPGQTGLVHFLRPRVSVEGEPPQILGQTGYPDGWYAFRRDAQGRYSVVCALGGDLEAEAHDVYETRFSGNARDNYQNGTLTAQELLRWSRFDPNCEPEEANTLWPNANWNAGRTSKEIVGRNLVYLGELEATKFGRVPDAGSVLLFDPQEDLMLQVFHWT